MELFYCLLRDLFHLTGMLDLVQIKARGKVILIMVILVIEVLNISH